MGMVEFPDGFGKSERRGAYGPFRVNLRVAWEDHDEELTVGCVQAERFRQPHGVFYSAR